MADKLERELKTNLSEVENENRHMEAKVKVLEDFMRYLLFK